MDRVSFVEVPYNDTWLRDTGPITPVPRNDPEGADAGQAFHLLDFRFTGWGGKFEAAADDRLVARLSEMGISSNSVTQAIDFPLACGASETEAPSELPTHLQ